MSSVNWAENTDIITTRHATGCELTFSEVKGCSTHTLGHAALTIIHPIDCYERKHKPTGTVLQRWVDTALNSCLRTLPMGGQNEVFIPLLHPSCHSEWCLWKELPCPSITGSHLPSCSWWSCCLRMGSKAR